MAEVDTPKDFVQSLDRGLAVIRAFNAERPELTLSEVARVTGLSRAAVRRFLLTLEELGYVGTNGRLFFLKPRVLDLGYAYLSSVSVAHVAQTHLEVLAAELKESCSASVLDGGNIIYTSRASTSRIMSVNLSVGHRLPAYVTSMGRVLLAALSPAELDEHLAEYPRPKLTPHTISSEKELRRELDVVRAQGYALIDQELEMGVRSVAAPIRDVAGKVIAAINVSAHASRVSVEDLTERFLPSLLRTAKSIEADLLIRR
jgi:IclR family transcriptional regulator, pca regulon regulatory protein